MTILPQIEHVVVAMLENRSLDNLCGWLYEDLAAPPNVFLPPGSRAFFDGLDPGMWNPRWASDVRDGSSEKVPIARVGEGENAPSHDPQETFANVTIQIYGSGAATPDPTSRMQGFVINYAKSGTKHPTDIMRTYIPGQVPVLSALARNFAISDAWFASVPSQTWANRSFLHAGTSNGHVDNKDVGRHADPLHWRVPTIFNVLEDAPHTWAVFHDTWILPPLTRVQFPFLWHRDLDDRFHHLRAFEDACATRGGLPRYSFVEPSFWIRPNDQHPPHDVAAGERFLYRIWQAVRASPDWPRILLVLLYDEHGGCFDHVLPPWGAAPPSMERAGDEGFAFDRLGVRVPAVVVSPWIEAGTVFRSDTATPYDHTSILATLRDWLGLKGATRLGARVADAPTLEHVLSRERARTDVPFIPRPPAGRDRSWLRLPNDLQRSIYRGTISRVRQEPRTLLSPVRRGVRAARKRRLRR